MSPFNFLAALFLVGEPCACCRATPPPHPPSKHPPGNEHAARVERARACMCVCRGKRKRAKPPPKKAAPKVATIFDCPFCGKKDSCSVRMDFDHKVCEGGRERRESDTSTIRQTPTCETRATGHETLTSRACRQYSVPSVLDSCPSPKQPPHPLLALPVAVTLFWSRVRLLSPHSPCWLCPLL